MHMEKKSYVVYLILEKLDFAYLSKTENAANHPTNVSMPMVKVSWKSWCTTISLKSSTKITKTEREKTGTTKGLIIEGIENDQERDNTDSIRSIVRIDRIEIDTETIKIDIDKETENVKEIEIEIETDITRIIREETTPPQFLQCLTQAICQIIVYSFIVRLGLHDSSFFNECLWASWLTLSFWINSDWWFGWKQCSWIINFFFVSNS